MGFTNDAASIARCKRAAQAGPRLATGNPYCEPLKSSPCSLQVLFVSGTVLRAGLLQVGLVSFTVGKTAHRTTGVPAAHSRSRGQSIVVQAIVVEAFVPEHPITVLLVQGKMVVMVVVMVMPAHAAAHSVSKPAATNPAVPCQGVAAAKSPVPRHAAVVVVMMPVVVRGHALHAALMAARAMPATVMAGTVMASAVMAGAVLSATVMATAMVAAAAVPPRKGHCRQKKCGYERG